MLIIKQIKIKNKNKQKQLINWDPFIPIFLPKKPEKIDPKKGKIIIDKYTIYLISKWNTSF